MVIYFKKGKHQWKRKPHYSTGLPITLTDEQLDVMRQRLRWLLQRWEDLRPRESMTLQFKM